VVGRNRHMGAEGTEPAGDHALADGRTMPFSGRIPEPDDTTDAFQAQHVLAGGGVGVDTHRLHHVDEVEAGRLNLDLDFVGGEGQCVPRHDVPGNAAHRVWPRSRGRARPCCAPDAARTGRRQFPAADPGPRGNPLPPARAQLPLLSAGMTCPMGFGQPLERGRLPVPAPFDFSPDQPIRCLQPRGSGVLPYWMSSNCSLTASAVLPGRPSPTVTS
jgi:hypothetical protein